MKPFSNRIILHYLIITVVSAALFIPFLGGVPLFDWDEINFAESAREMIASGNYLDVQINFESFWEKPPLFIWMQVLSMQVFGITEFAARFPNAVCGIITLLALYTMGRKLYNPTFGLYWVLAYTGSVLPFVYFKSGIIDPWFNLFIFISIYYFIIHLNASFESRLWLVLSGFFLGLAVLTKGPVAVLIFVLAAVVFWIQRKFRMAVNLRDVLVFLLVLGFTGGFWFILQILTGNFNVIADFIVYQIRLFRTTDAGHGGFLLYHVVILLFGVFPASIMAIPAFFKEPAVENDFQKLFKTWMILLFLVVLVLFTIVRTKIVHYSSLCYFPMTFLAAFTLHNTSRLKSWKPFVFISTAVLAFLYSIITILLTKIDSFKQRLIDLDVIRDDFAVENMKADGGWAGYEFIAGMILLSGAILFVVFWRRGRIKKAMISILLTTSSYMFCAMWMITPHIEKYSQHAAVEFFQSVSGEDVYLATLGYKSYTPLFYGRIKMHENENSRDTQWLLTGDIDKTAYFAMKITRKSDYLDEYPELEVLYEKNGFVFCKRIPS